MKVSTGVSVAMPILAFPSDAEIAKVIGHLVIAHTELELVMRYTVKTLSGGKVDDVLSSTSEDRVKELREKRALSLCRRCVWADTAEYQGRRLILRCSSAYLTLQPRRRSVAVDYLL